jgi:DNA topoisomerase-1
MIAMQLIIAEKPKVAQKIADALSNKKSRKIKGYGKAYYFEFELNSQKVIVAPAVGHLYTLDEKNKSSTYPTFDIDWYPAYQVSTESKYTQDYIKTIEKIAKEADEVIIACDYDIEGSLIGYNVLRFAARKNDGKRMKFSSLIDEELKEAYLNRRELDLENALAGETRHILDWYYGINLSRALMSSIKTAGRFQIMSIGRVQGPALNILGKRELEIKAFKPKPYWEVSCVVNKIRFLHIKKRFEKKEDAILVLDKSKSPPHKIEKILAKKFNEKPKPPFDLTSLQIEAYKHFKFTPNQTQEIAQTLYENSLISYPRTSSQKLPSKLGFQKIIEKIGKQNEYQNYSKKIIEQKRFKPIEGKKDDPAHPAIHPTGIIPQNLGQKEKKIYDLIVRRFLACFYEDAQRETQKIILNCNGEQYFVEGTRTIKEGWHEVYKPYLDLEETELPRFQEGEEVKISKFSIEEKQTKPPKRYTPASIVAELEKKGLGTKATRATIIETLFKRNYITGKKAIVVSPFGLAVIDVLKKYAPEILDEELTRKIEEDMEKIQLNLIKPKDVIEKGKEILIKVLQKFKNKETEVGAELNVGLIDAKEQQMQLGDCPKCNGKLKIIRINKKQFVGCSNYPECKQTYPLPQSAKIEPINEICNECKTPKIRVIRKGKKTFIMCLDPNCKTKNNWNNKKE